MADSLSKKGDDFLAETGWCNWFFNLEFSSFKVSISRRSLTTIASCSFSISFIISSLESLLCADIGEEEGDDDVESLRGSRATAGLMALVTEVCLSLDGLATAFLCFDSLFIFTVLEVAIIILYLLLML